MATVTRYVDTASAGGDGTTQGHAGATAAYASLSAWEAAEQTDLVTDGDVHVCNVAGGADNTSFTITGWTTGSSNFITIQGDSSAPDSDGVNSTGIFSTLFYYIDNDAGAARQVTISETHCVFQDLQIRYSTAAGSGDIVLGFQDAGDNPTCARLICQISQSGTNNRLIQLDGATGSLVEACVLTGAGSTTDEGVRCRSSGADGTIQNCTLENLGEGIRTENSSGAFTARNCAFLNNTDDINDTASALTIDYCATDDGDGTNAQDMGGSDTTWNKQVIDYANGDFNVKDTDSVLHNTGTSTGQPSADVTGTSYTTDDIGAFASAGTAPAAAATADGMTPWLPALSIG